MCPLDISVQTSLEIQTAKVLGKISKVDEKK